MESLQINIKLEQVSNKFLLHLKKIAGNVTLTYNAIKSEKFDPNLPLPTDSLPLNIDDNKKQPTFDEQKDQAIKWLFQKAFEELIIGLTTSLIEAYRYLKLYELASQDTHSRSKDQLENEMEKIEKKAHKLHFPALIKEIEGTLGQSLLLRDEILSINQVRNCLVHRNGIVHQNDLKDDNGEGLTLKWNSPEFYTWKKNGERVKLDYKTREKEINTNKLESFLTGKQKTFKLNDQLLIDIDHFNDISYTCAIFVTKLNDVLPRP